ncbi:hypothetical protein H8356DRAFT_1339629 [Neocallimastix lanati (nom. inval.)]|nr:hypothetical protein H8356DRAFT_1339629 [Neocallimastix sp. JGI-2020a]
MFGLMKFHSVIEFPTEETLEKLGKGVSHTQKIHLNGHIMLSPNYDNSFANFDTSHDSVVSYLDHQAEPPDLTHTLSKIY